MRPKLPSKTHATNFKITASWINSVVDNLTELWTHVKGDGKTIRVSDTGTVSYIGSHAGSGGGGYPVRSFQINKLVKESKMDDSNRKTPWIYAGKALDLWNPTYIPTESQADFLLIPAQFASVKIPLTYYPGPFFCARCESAIDHPEGKKDDQGKILKVVPYILLEFWMFNGGLLPQEDQP